MAIWLGALVLLLLAIAGVFWMAARFYSRSAGLAFGARIVYSDTGAWEKVERALYSQSYGLAGRPDYIVEENGVMVPVEVKPNRAAREPRESDVMQLAAYGLLLEETYAASPPYGLLKYRDVVFRIDLSPALRQELLAIMQEMRQDLNSADVERDHDEPGRCRGCGYRQVCGQVLE